MSISEQQAIIDQETNSVLMKGISALFRSNTGTLGSEMYKDTWKANDEAATRQLLQKVIANIRDE